MNNFDFTKEIALEPSWKKKYFYSRIFVYALFLASVFYLAYLLLFPSAPFTFSFLNPNSSKNTLVDPRNDREEKLSNGKISANQKIIFNANLDGTFSKASVQFSLDNKSAQAVSGNVSIRKSFRSFLYPTGKPMGFPDGSLLKNKGNFYAVSQGKLRRFANENVTNALGFNQEAFLEVADEELDYNDKGYAIDSVNYPEDSLFRIQDNYYQLRGGQLSEFISEKAYLTRYNAGQAIQKDASFLNNYPLSENKIGFADGSLVSFDIGAYVVSENNIYPIADPRTFELMGFSWDDVIPISEDDLAFYARQPLFTINDPHPNGTIFLEKEDGKYYLIENGQKRELTGLNIVKIYLKRKPIEADKASLTVSSSCRIRKNGIIWKTYSCEVDLRPFQNLSGNDFELASNFDSDVQAANVSVTFKKSFDHENMRLALADIKNKIILNYVGQ
jgi:hypothetical protein